MARSLFVALILQLLTLNPLSYLALFAWRRKMIVLFPEMRGKEIIEQSGLRTLLVQAFLAVAEQELKQEKMDRKSEPVKTPHAIPTVVSCSSLKNHFIEKNI